MKKKSRFLFFLVCLIFISCTSISNSKKNELINLNPMLFHNGDNCAYIGKMDLSPKQFIEIYFIEHLFGNSRANYRLVFFDNNNSISCYRVEDKPTLINGTLLFPYKKELGNKITLETGIPDKIYLNGEVIELLTIK
ncbi:MAG: hypothetical protein IJ530_12655 [Treponema sp.]|uniref:hypothetical protein n=1 Tax=Treponema sp. TaxID=166 RepID=UPI0025DDF1A9|nr:hypothetical protein [Treponema sp.]MBQ8680591.1 hypothetical protein [Treponema sp.]